MEKYFETKIGQQLQVDMNDHIGVIIGLLNETNVKNFAYLKSQVDLDSGSSSESEGQESECSLEEMIADPSIAIRRKLSWFSFVMEEKSALVDNPFLMKTVKLVKTSDLEYFTDLRTVDSDSDSDSVNLVVFLPVTFRLFNSRSKNYRAILTHLLKIFGDMDYLTIQEPLGCFQLDQAIEALFQLEKTFWDQVPLSVSLTHQHDDAEHLGNLCSAWLLGMRIRNQTYTETMDFENMVADINDGEFTNDPNNIYSMGNGTVISAETFEKSSAFDNWKKAIPFQPLDVSKYYTVFSLEEVNHLFRSLMAHSNKMYFLKIYGLFLSSYRLCHLLMDKGSGIMEEAMELFVLSMADPKYKYMWNNNKTFEAYYYERGLKGYRSDEQYNLGGRNIFQRMSFILYMEERMLGGSITSQHRSMMNIDFANLLPMYFKYEVSVTNFRQEIKVAPNAYFPMPNVYHMSLNIPFDHLNKRNKICDNQEFKKRFDIVSGGMLDGLDWENVYFTGSLAEVCYYKNGLYPFDFLMSKNKYNPYLDSDIDLGIWIHMKEENGDDISYDDARIKAELLRKAEYIVSVVRKNYGLSEDDLVLKPKNSRWIISHPKLPREIDIFSFIVDPAALVYNYHMATCRVVWQGSRGAQVLSSGILSAMLGTCVDRRWFSSSTSIHYRILKQFRRGIGLVLNPQEMKVVIQYIHKWNKENPGELNFIQDMTNVRNGSYHTVDLTDTASMTNVDNYVHLNLFKDRRDQQLRIKNSRFHRYLGQYLGLVHF